MNGRDADALGGPGILIEPVRVLAMAAMTMLDPLAVRVAEDVQRRQR